MIRGVMDDLRRVVRALRLTARAAEKRLSVSGAQLFVLQQLEQRPASSMAKLAARTFTDQSSVSAIVSRLEERGLAARRRSHDARRRVEIELTPRGRALMRRAPAPAQVRILDGLRRMRSSEINALAVSLRTLVDHLGMSGERPAMFFESDHV